MICNTENSPLTVYDFLLQEMDKYEGTYKKDFATFKDYLAYLLEVTEIDLEMIQEIDSQNDWNIPSDSDGFLKTKYKKESNLLQIIKKAINLLEKIDRLQ